jgi:hypothetical protein
MSIIFLVLRNLKEFLTSCMLQICSGQNQNLLSKIPIADKLHTMKLPARFLLAVLTLSIGFLTPVASPQTIFTNSETSNCCAIMNTGVCHSCPAAAAESTSAPGAPCCATQSGCFALYFTRTKTFSASVHLLGVIRVSDEPAITRTQRPPVPPPRGVFI